MGIRDYVRRLQYRPPAEERAIDKMDLWGRGQTVDLDSWAGINVSRESAARVVAVYACVRLRAETVAGLPASVYRRQGEERIEIDPPPLWLRRPNPEQSWFEFTERVNTCLDLDGNGFLLITARDRLGFPAELWTLHPDQIEVRRSNRSGRIFYVWNGAQEFQPFDGINGDLLHIRNLGWGQDRAPSPIGQARNAIGLGIAAEKFGARFFGSGQQLSGVLTIPETVTPVKAQEFVQQMRDLWQAEHGGTDKAHLPGVLTGGATWTPISINPEDAQFLETRKFQVAEIARMYGIPPHMIGDVEKSTSWGTGIEQQQIGFVQYSINPRLARLEDAFNQLLPRGQFIKWNVNGLLRGDSKSRAEFYGKGIQNGWLLRSEARQLEDLPEEDGLEKPLIPTNMKVLGEEPPASAPVAEGTPVDGSSD